MNNENKNLYNQNYDTSNNIQTENNFNYYNFTNIINYYFFN